MKDIAATFPAHVYSRHGTFPTGNAESSPVEFRIRDDEVDGLHFPARAAFIANDSAASEMHFSTSPDSLKWTRSIQLPAGSIARFHYDDGVDISMIRAWGTVGQAYRVMACPGRSHEPPIATTPRKFTGAKITAPDRIA